MDRTFLLFVWYISLVGGFCVKSKTAKKNVLLIEPPERDYDAMYGI